LYNDYRKLRKKLTDGSKLFKSFSFDCVLIATFQSLSCVAAAV
jgi:hypothetical protein